jgi:site-specific DNA-methyltransferase (adenine-specific)
LGEGYVPGSYLEYLDMLAEVLGRCLEKLEPGGRIAINVANLGRRPYRSLSADVIGVLQDDLGMLLRGEIIWRKAKVPVDPAPGEVFAARPTRFCAT